MEKFNDILETIAGFNALELSELVKAMEEKFGISAAMPVGVAAGAGAGDAAAADEKTAWNVPGPGLKSGKKKLSSPFRPA